MRALAGGLREFATVISKGLHSAFAGTEFFLDPIAADQMGIFWSYKSPGAPTEKMVSDYMGMHFGTINITLGDSANSAFAGRTGGLVGTGESTNGSILGGALVTKTKNCPHCHTSTIIKSKFCEKCRYVYPHCWKCKTLFAQPDAKFCSACGWTRFPPVYNPAPLPPGRKNITPAAGLQPQEIMVLVIVIILGLIMIFKAWTR